MYVRMYVSLGVLVICISAFVRARLCMSARACAFERRERLRNTTARPLDAIHHVGMYMCEQMYVHMDVRVHSMQVSVLCVRAYVRARARRERHTRAPTRGVSLRAYICVRMIICMCMSGRVDFMGECACA